MLTLNGRRGKSLELDKAGSDCLSIPEPELAHFERFDDIYRSLCALMYNFVPLSGHPGGSISSGRFVQAVLFQAMDYDFSQPDRRDADVLSYAAGHKALGLYSLWALRNEIVRLGAPALLPGDEKYQLRLEDLLGFRRNPVTRTPLFKKFGVKPLDGHPTPATPFLRLATGASGVGVASSVGLALGAADTYGADAPRVHIVEGEGGMTPGRVAEAFAAAATASLGNVVLHLDWNQASIDSNRVCADETGRGDYVQWTPMEFAHLHDWNVLYVPDGKDFRQVLAAQRRALAFDNGQPTAVVYRTTKGWKYGIEGRASHGAGHKLCSPPFLGAIEPLFAKTGERLCVCPPDAQECGAGAKEDVLEECFWEALLHVRRALERDEKLVSFFAGRLVEAKKRLDARARRPRVDGPRVQAVFESAKKSRGLPAELALKPGAVTTLRAELGKVMNHYNKIGNGAVLTAAADLLGSTSISTAGAGFPEGFYNAKTNPGSRMLSLGGICEDAMSGVLAGLSTFGHHIGVGSSYGAFIAPLGHIAARLHAIGSQSRNALKKEPFKPFMLVCAHAGLKTGEDGPTHADPQALQLLQENFPPGMMVTLTPWDPQELWPLVTAALAARPAVIAAFVTRPNETVPDRDALKLAPPEAAADGVYLLNAAKGEGDGTVVLQESGVAYAFIEQALPLLRKKGVDLNVYYVASAELFDALPAARRARVFPEKRAQTAMGITGFTFATMYRWILSDAGRAATLHPFRKGHFLGSGQAAKVLQEAGLDGESQYKAILAYLNKKSRRAK